MNYVIAASYLWDPRFVSNLCRRTGSSFYLIQEKDELSLSRLKKISPHHIFFPHWSYRIPPEIFMNYECIVFHMTDVPYGRGGTPLQNLIIRRKKKTKISALRATAKFDAGPVYLKRALSLKGTAQAIYRRSFKIIEDMIVAIITRHPKPFLKGAVLSYLSEESQRMGISEILNHLAWFTTIYECWMRKVIPVHFWKRKI